MQIKIVIFIVILSCTNVLASNFFDETGLLYKNGQFAAVEAKCIDKLKTDKNSIEAYFYLVGVRLHSGRFNEAIPYMEKFAQIHKDREKEESLKQGGSFLLIDARFAVLYYELGRFYFENNQFHNAKEWFSHAKVFYYNEPNLNFYIGICSKETGKYADAIKYFERQLEQNPNEPSPLYNIACVYAEQGKKAEAIKWLTKSIEAYPDFKDQAINDKDFDSIRNSHEFKNVTN